MLLDLIVPFVSTFLAELGDKTQLAVLSLSSKTKNYFSLFLGVLFAFIIIDGLAIYFGAFIFNLIPLFWVKIISGSLFLLFGVYGFLSKEDDENIKIKKSKNIFVSSFILILFAELGDKSQIAAALFSSIYSPLLVFIGVILSLSLLTILTIFIGKFLLKKFNSKKLSKISNVVFILIGLITLISII